MAGVGFLRTFPICVLLVVSLGPSLAQQRSPVEPAISSGLQRLTGIQQQATPDGVRVTIHLEKNVGYQVGQATGPDRLFIDFSATEPEPGLRVIHIGSENGMLRQIRVAQYQPTTTRVVFDLNRMVSYHASYLSNPPRVVIELHPERSDAAQKAPSKLKDETAPKSAFLQPATVKPSSLSPAIDSPKGNVPKLSVQGATRSKQAKRNDSSDLAGKNVRDADLFRLMQRADGGDVEAQLMLGFAHELGSFGSVNYASAIRWYKRAADQGNTAAAIRIGDMYALGRGVSRNGSEAKNWYGIAGLDFQSADSRAVQLGATLGLVMSNATDAPKADQPSQPDFSSPATKNDGREPTVAAAGKKTPSKDTRADAAEASLRTNPLLRLPFEARDVPSDPAAAAQMYRKASEKDFPEAQFRLANMYMNGQGVERNQAEAAKLYTRAAQRGHLVAQSNLGVLYANGWGVPADDVAAVNWFRRAAMQGDVGGESNLGAMYLAGRGVPQNDVEAARWLRMAGEKGQAEAQYGLGTLYVNGRGVPHDNAEAVKWFQKASEQGYAPARLALAAMYAAGQVTGRDDKQAAAYIRAAADRGVPEAEYQLGILYQQGRGVTKNDDEAMRWLNRAATQGLPAAQYQLGEIFRDGQGAAKNLVTAYSWFALAAATGDEHALSALNSLAPRMTLNQIADGQRLAIATAPHLKGSGSDKPVIGDKSPAKTTGTDTQPR